MIVQIENYILGALQALFDTWGWYGVVAMMIFENATGITPSEIILGLAGWFLLSTHGQPFSMVFLGGLYAAIGSIIGASITYWVSRLGGRPLIDRIAAWVRIDPALLLRAEQLFQRWGPKIVLFGRLVPGVRTLISIPAGLARMPFPQFALATFAGAYGWCTLLIGLGYFLGYEWERFSALFKQYALAVGLIVAALFLAWLAGRELWYRYLARTHTRSEYNEE
ncbi:MAG: DedA family protein [Chloroflexi bacterium]|nr:DedA family protein [Chloroflexota bacterium]